MCLLGAVQRERELTDKGAGKRRALGPSWEEARTDALSMRGRREFSLLYKRSWAPWRSKVVRRWRSGVGGARMLRDRTLNLKPLAPRFRERIFQTIKLCVLSAWAIDLSHREIERHHTHAAQSRRERERERERVVGPGITIVPSFPYQLVRKVSPHKVITQ